MAAWLLVSQPVMSQNIWQFDSWHRGLGLQFDSLSRRLDHFLGADYEVKDQARSRVRLRLDSSLEQGEGFKIRPHFSARLVLPALRKRFRIWLTTDNINRESSIGGIGREGSDMGQTNVSGTQLMLRLLEHKNQRYRLKLDLGLRRYDAKLQPFGRLRWSYRLPLQGPWSSRLFDSYRYFSLSGVDNEAGFSIQRLMGREQRTAARFSHRLRWEANRDGVLHLSQLTLFHALANKREIALELLTRYRSMVDPQQGDKFELAAIRLRYRRSWLRPWLFLELWPGVSWPATRQHHASLGFLIRTEVMFGR